jgi:hypothetical protein
MTFKEIVAEVPGLSVEEKLALLDILHHSLTEVWQRAERSTDVEADQRSSILELRGFLKAEGLPSDERLKSDYVDYLIEKYR